jgi:uncharacterized membrane protein YgcG
VSSYDPNNVAQADAFRFMTELEEAVQEQPPQAQLRGGKGFATHAKWATMTPQEQAKHWTADADNLQRWVSVKASLAAKEEWGRRQAMLQKYTGGKIQQPSASPAAHVLANLSGGRSSSSNDDGVTNAGTSTKVRSGFATGGGSSSARAETGISGFLRGIGVVK